MICTSCNASMAAAQAPFCDQQANYFRCLTCLRVTVDGSVGNQLALESESFVREPGVVACPQCEDTFLDKLGCQNGSSLLLRHCRKCSLISFSADHALHHQLDLETSLLGQLLTSIGLLLRHEQEQMKRTQLPASFHIENARPTGLKCPHCDHGLTLYSVHDRSKEAAADFEICDACFGIWLDRDDLLASCERQRSHSLQVDYESIQPSLRVCPKCREITLFSMKFQSIDTVIDCCPDCFGTWLDGGELSEFCEHLSGDDHDVIDALVDNAIFRKPALCKTLRQYSQTLFRLDEKVAEQEKDLEQAHFIQNHLLFSGKEPTSFPAWEFGGYQVAGLWQPAQTVGGDYFDLVPLKVDDQDHLLLCVADVSGKGLPASLLMANFQALLRSFATSQPQPAALCDALNRVLYQNTASNKYITAFIGLLNLEQHRLSFVNAGHNPPILMRPGEQSLLKTGGTVLGLLPDWAFQQQDIELGAEDRLLLYTDGVTEATNADDEDLGEEALAQWLLHKELGRGRDAVTWLVRHLREFCQGQFDDDATMLFLERAQ